MVTQFQVSSAQSTPPVRAGEAYFRACDKIATLIPDSSKRVLRPFEAVALPPTIDRLRPVAVSWTDASARDAENYTSVSAGKREGILRMITSCIMRSYKHPLEAL